MVIGFVFMLATTAYLTRGIQLVLGRPKRAITERAKEIGVEDDSIPLAQSSRNPSTPETVSIGDLTQDFATGSGIAHPSRARDPSEVRGTGGPPQLADLNTVEVSPSVPRQNVAPPRRAEKWASFAISNLDTLTYAALFIFVGLPIYYAFDYAMPAHLTWSILAYFAAISMPHGLKRYLHPVLVSSGCTTLGIWLLALTQRSKLNEALKDYATKTRYLQLLDGKGPGHPSPGAGDMFSSALDVSILALAIPMFRYRSELKRHFPSILTPNILLATASLFGYPALCHAIGISTARSLSFASRSLTLALATPATQNLGGDLQLVAVLCIMSGVMGVLVAPTLLRWLRIPEDDYVTRGVALGGNSSAIATALLLVSDPRAAALSSLSMSIFGTVMVALTSVPVVAEVVNGIAGAKRG